MSNIQIVASVLVRDENIYIERVIRNILDFCDKVIITDHQSIDGTFEICQRLANEFPKIELRRIHSLSESFEAIKPYCNTKTWIFAVDGDEIFDSTGLREMRRHLLQGEFSEYWNIYANTLHCIKLDVPAPKAWGYLAPRHVLAPVFITFPLFMIGRIMARGCWVVISFLRKGIIPGSGSFYIKRSIGSNPIFDMCMHHSLSEV